MTRRPLLLIPLLLFAFVTADAQPFDSLVHATLVGELRSKSVPGGVAAVLSGTRTACLVAAGTANTVTNEPMTAEMLFRLGSTTKMFVATTALLIANEGKIDLQAPIRRYLAGLPPILSSITLHQLLTHTSGISDEAPMYGPPDDSALTREIASWTDDRVFLQPGEAFSYSNPGYWLIGRVLEAVEKKPFAEVVRDRVLLPLGMVRSTFRPEIAARYPLAAGHDRDQDLIDPPPNHAGTWPSGSLYSNAPELLRFASAVMNDGMLDGHRVFPAEVVRQLLRPYATVKGLPGTTYGYGMIFKLYREEPVAYHSGSRLGYGSIIDFAPGRKVAVIVLGNRTGSLLSSTVHAGFESQFRMGKYDEGKIPDGGRYITEEGEMSPFVGRFINREPIAVEIYNRSALPIIRIGEILTFKRGYERIPLQIVDDTTASNGYQRIALTKDVNGRVRLLHIEMHTLRRINDAVE